MNFKILFVLAVCFWNCLPAHSGRLKEDLKDELKRLVPFSLKKGSSKVKPPKSNVKASPPKNRLGELKSLTIDEIENPERLTENVELADSILVHAIASGLKELDDDMLFRLGDLCYRLETMCANKKQYKIFIGHLEQYNDKFWDTVRTIMRGIGSDIDGSSNVFNRQIKEYQKKTEYPFCRSIASVSDASGARIFAYDAYVVMSLLFRLNKAGYDQTEIASAFVKLIYDLHFGDSFYNWKTVARSCSSKNTDPHIFSELEFQTFNVFLTTIATREEITSNQRGSMRRTHYLADRFFTEYILSDQEARGLKNLLLDLYGQPRIDLDNNHRQIHHSFLSHYKSKLIGSDTPQMRDMERIMICFIRKENRRLGEVGTIILEILMEPFKRMKEIDKVEWIKKQENAIDILTLQLTLDLYNDEPDRNPFQILHIFPEVDIIITNGKENIPCDTLKKLYQEATGTGKHANASQNGGKENEKKVIPNQPQIIIPFSKILEKQKMIEAKANVNKQ